MQINSPHSFYPHKKNETKELGTISGQLSFKGTNNDVFDDQKLPKTLQKTFNLIKELYPISYDVLTKDQLCPEVKLAEENNIANNITTFSKLFEVKGQAFATTVLSKSTRQLEKMKNGKDFIPTFKHFKVLLGGAKRDFQQHHISFDVAMKLLKDKDTLVSLVSDHEKRNVSGNLNAIQNLLNINDPECLDPNTFMPASSQESVSARVLNIVTSIENSSKSYDLGKNPQRDYLDSLLSSTNDILESQVLGTFARRAYAEMITPTTEALKSKFQSYATEEGALAKEFNKFVERQNISLDLPPNYLEEQKGFIQRLNGILGKKEPDEIQFRPGLLDKDCRDIYGRFKYNVSTASPRSDYPFTLEWYMDKLSLSQGKKLMRLIIQHNNDTPNHEKYAEIDSIKDMAGGMIDEEHRPLIGFVMKNMDTPLGPSSSDPTLREILLENVKTYNENDQTDSLTSIQKNLSYAILNKKGSFEKKVEPFLQKGFYLNHMVRTMSRVAKECILDTSIAKFEQLEAIQKAQNNA